MLANLWSEFLTIVKEEAGSRVVETWFKAVSFYQWDALEKTAYLEAPNNFVKSWIKNHYIPLIQIHLGRLLNVSMPKIVFVETGNHAQSVHAVVSEKSKDCS